MHLSAVLTRVLPRKEVGGEESGGPQGGKQTFQYSALCPLQDMQPFTVICKPRPHHMLAAIQGWLAVIP